MGWQNGIARTGSQLALPQGVRLRILPVDALLLGAKEDAELPLREGPAVAPLPWRACVAPLSEWRGALHRLQAVRGDLPSAGDHHRSGPPAQRRYAARNPLRHRYGEVHLLRPLSGGLPGRRYRRGPELRVRDRDARGALLRQGAVARERRPMGARDRENAGARCALQVGSEEEMSAAESDAGRACSA